jgi:hypothetical protein
MDAGVGYRRDVTAWRIGDSLGQGAVGRVVRVHRDDGATAPLAGKILHASHRADPAASARFVQEARIAAGLSHPNIVGVLGIESIEGEDVLLMEFVDGPTLAQHLARHAPLDERSILALARQIAAGLAHAHGRGVVHRDLKPANILLAAGVGDREPVAKIADFGMARGSSVGDDAGAAERQSAFTVLGTPDYMAPECLDPLAVDARADLYALGCILFEMATGRPPFVGATAHAVLRAHRDDDVPPLPPVLSSALHGLIRGLLAKSPGQRPQAATAVIAALDRIARGDATALAVRSGEVVRCMVCGRSIVPGVGACLSCGQALMRHEPGACTVVVVGPGDVGDKIDGELRERLVRWLAGQPDLAMTPSKALAGRIPRLPFTLARGLGRAQADAIVEALAVLGIQATTSDRHPLTLAPMRKKAATMSARVGLVALTSSAGIISSGVGLVTALVATVALVVGTTFVSARGVTRRSAAPEALPAALRAALGRTVVALPEIVSERHRDALRAVIERATELATDPALGPDAGSADELARAVDAATVAAASLERLDRALLGPQLGGETSTTRDTLRTRDLWAARLQAVLAELDAIRDRLAAARSHAHARGAEDELAVLSAHVEALEEIQR